MADLDHRSVDPPYLRVVIARKATEGDEWTARWDFRLVQPNEEQVPVPVIHTLEHFLGTYLEEHEPTIMGVAPMGCMTGLYVWTTGLWSFDRLADVLAAGLGLIADATDVPKANIIECGCAREHSLEGAKEYAALLLQQRADWSSPGPSAHEVRKEDLVALAGNDYAPVGTATTEG